MRQAFILAALLTLGAGCKARKAVADPAARASRLPPGFSIEAAVSAPQRLALVRTFTFDSRGRPVVVMADGKGWATLLLDNNGDGFFETERVLSTATVGKEE